MNHILLTGARGRVGSHTLRYLLARNFRVTSLDIRPLDQTSNSAKHVHHTLDLTDFKAFEDVLNTSPTRIDGVIHLSAIPDPLTHDARVVHNSNVTSSYNVLKTASDYGIRRIVQASSVNAHGLGYSPDGHHRWDELPLTEEVECRPEDAYAISKAMCELQAAAMVRWQPGLRIASLRFHHCEIDYPTSVPLSMWNEGFAWTSYDAAASACLLGLTSEGWEGAEVFNIVAPEICWEGGLGPDGKEVEERYRGKVPTLDILERCWSGRYGKIRKEWYEKNPRGSLWDSTKAERMLGWDHDKS